MLPEAFTRARIETNGAEIVVAHGGEGPPLLLLHGYPQTSAMWHAVAAWLAADFHVVCPDLRGYGDSSKPVASSDHREYSKRAMALDNVELMTALGYTEFFVVGHDRGARVAHRMMLDQPRAVRAACVLDIVPTFHMFRTTDQWFATGYYHWFFLIQPDGLPEQMIGADPDYYLREKLKRWSAAGFQFAPEAVAEYLRCFRAPDCIHASCEDYRAAATIDLTHDEADRDRRIECPLLVLWGQHGFVHRAYDVLEVWRDYAVRPEGQSLACGHFVAEEAPRAFYDELMAFFRRYW